MVGADKTMELWRPPNTTHGYIGLLSNQYLSDQSARQAMLKVVIINIIRGSVIVAEWLRRLYL